MSYVLYSVNELYMYCTQICCMYHFLHSVQCSAVWKAAGFLYSTVTLHAVSSAHQNLN